MENIALFASGAGSNAENIVRYFRNSSSLEFPLILSNNPNAGVHERARILGVPSFSIGKKGFEDGEALLLLKKFRIDFIVLAGFLLKIPLHLLEAYPGRIINIHPALLPKYGGKGMYGSHVHEAVVANRETESGITIHYVNEHYDEGNIIFQAKCGVSPSDSPEDVAEKVHALEYKYFPEIILKTVQSRHGGGHTVSFIF
jgi:phosphoribosylglycinamide formyltransferase-1